MKIHWPSLGIGIAGVSIIIMVIFFTSGENIVKILPLGNGSQNTQNIDQNITLEILTANSSPVFGSNDAPITMIEFGDYQCFYCNKFFHNTEDNIVKNYVDTGKVKLIFKDFTIIGQDSVTAANAAHCAQEQGKFWEYHDILYSNWSGENTGWVSTAHLLQFAKQASLNENQFSQCLTQKKYTQVVRGSVSDANTLGLMGTPDFFIISPDSSITKVVGAQPYEVFDEIFKSKLQWENSRL